MLGASVSKEKVKSFYVLKHCYVYMSSSVCYFYFSPAIDKTQPIFHAVIPLRFLILIFLFDSTVATKENLHLKKKFKTDNSEYVEREWKFICNEFFKCAMTYM